MRTFLESGKNYFAPCAVYTKEFMRAAMLGERDRRQQDSSEYMNTIKDSYKYSILVGDHLFCVFPVGAIPAKLDEACEFGYCVWDIKNTSKPKLVTNGTKTLPLSTPNVHELYEELRRTYANDNVKELEGVCIARYGSLEKNPKKFFMELDGAIFAHGFAPQLVFDFTFPGLATYLQNAKTEAFYQSFYCLGDEIQRVASKVFTNQNVAYSDVVETLFNQNKRHAIIERIRSFEKQGITQLDFDISYTNQVYNYHKTKDLLGDIEQIDLWCTPELTGKLQNAWHKDEDFNGNVSVSLAVLSPEENAIAQTQHSAQIAPVKDGEAVSCDYTEEVEGVAINPYLRSQELCFSALEKTALYNLVSGTVIEKRDGEFFIGCMPFEQYAYVGTSPTEATMRKIEPDKLLETMHFVSCTPAWIELKDFDVTKAYDVCRMKDYYEASDPDKAFRITYTDQDREINTLIIRRLSEGNYYVMYADDRSQLLFRCNDKNSAVATYLTIGALCSTDKAITKNMLFKEMGIENDGFASLELLKDFFPLEPDMTFSQAYTQKQGL